MASKLVLSTEAGVRGARCMLHLAHREENTRDATGDLTHGTLRVARQTQDVSSRSREYVNEIRFYPLSEAHSLKKMYSVLREKYPEIHDNEDCGRGHVRIEMDYTTTQAASYWFGSVPPQLEDASWLRVDSYCS
ncbi:hypothetical protein [Rhodoligotrophos defluvii]|uniref:hypothetical protein n=1 Tax=Rhodoligotrophos defluvii TaxID=2561934 RepID=UPI0010C95382|nr:hypothetical protein [Rhodoligotrophos defluvii]